MSDHRTGRSDTHFPTRRFLTTAEAAQYCGFKTTGAIRKAKLHGRITPIAEGTGPYGSDVYARDDVERFFLQGNGAIEGMDHPSAPPQEHSNEEQTQIKEIRT